LGQLRDRRRGPQDRLLGGHATANVIINSTAISSGATVSCSAATITFPMQGT
jgi:hypothetical protein